MGYSCKDMGYSCKDIGNRIRFLREANNLTRDSLSEMADISTKFLYEIELGKKGFTVEVLFKLAKALDISCDYILCGTEVKKIPGKMIDVLESFTPEQMGRIQDILKVVQELCAGEDA